MFTDKLLAEGRIADDDFLRSRDIMVEDDCDSDSDSDDEEDDQQDVIRHMQATIAHHEETIAGLLKALHKKRFTPATALPMPMPSPKTATTTAPSADGMWSLLLPRPDTI